MKLAEAKKRVDELGDKIIAKRAAISLKPIDEIHAAINDIVELMAERDSLIRRIMRTEWATEVAGTSLAETLEIIDSIALRVSVLESLDARSDELPELEAFVKSNITHFNKTKENLEFLYQKNLWSVDILDE